MTRGFDPSARDRIEPPIQRGHPVLGFGGEVGHNWEAVVRRPSGAGLVLVTTVHGGLFLS